MNCLRVTTLITLCQFLIVSTVNGDVIFDAVEVGNDVVISGEGSIDLSGLGSPGNLERPGRIQANEFLLVAPGLANATFDTYEVTGATGPANIGPGTVLFNADIGIGDDFGYDFAFGTIAVPDGYASGDDLMGTIVFENHDFSSLGLESGSYVWTAGNNQITMSVSAVPEPGSVTLIATLAMLTSLRRRRS